MADYDMGLGDYSFDLDELKKMQEAMGMGVSASPIAETAPELPQDRTQVMSKYKDDIMKKIQASEGNLMDAEEAYKTSQEAGTGWGSVAAKGAGVFADTLSGLAGQKGGYTKGVIDQYDKTKLGGEKAYKNALEKEKGNLEELTALEKREATDPNSDESVSARLFAKETYGIELPENTNSIQAKVYMDLYAKKNNMANVEEWKKKNFDQRERAIAKEDKKEAEEAKKVKPTPFSIATEKKQASRFADTQEAIPNIAKNMEKVDNAIDAQLKYSKDSMFGTGPIATLGGMTKYASEESQNLEAKFREINLKNMVSTFSGMSKAVDSDAERRAWESTQASLSNDDAVNLKILMGAKSTLLKDRAVAEAQNAYVQQNGNLSGFEQANPILRGDVTTLVDPSGEMQLVPKTEAAQMEQQGYKKLDDYVEAMVDNDYAKPTTQATQSSGGSPWEKYRR